MLGISLIGPYPPLCIFGFYVICCLCWVISLSGPILHCVLSCWASRAPRATTRKGTKALLEGKLDIFDAFCRILLQNRQGHPTLMERRAPKTLSTATSNESHHGAGASWRQVLRNKRISRRVISLNRQSPESVLNLCRLMSLSPRIR
jgi:hypothetical protein